MATAKDNTNITNRKDNLRFQIHQIRLDKLIYTLESCAITLGALIIVISANQYVPLPSGVKNIITVLALSVAVGYGLVIAGGNISRWFKLRKLEKELK